MGFLSALTLVLIVLKLIGYITWPWFYVLAPLLFEIVMGILGLFYYVSVVKNLKVDFDEED